MNPAEIEMLIRSIAETIIQAINEKEKEDRAIAVLAAMIRELVGVAYCVRNERGDKVEMDRLEFLEEQLFELCPPPKEKS